MAEGKTNDLASKANPHHTAIRLICCCACLLVTILGLTLVIYFVAHDLIHLKHKPRLQRPSFHVTSMKITQFNFTTTPDGLNTKIISKYNVSISIRNPNEEAALFYNMIDFSVYSSCILVGEGSFRRSSFLQQNRTNIVLQDFISSTTQVYDESYYFDSEALDLLELKVYLRRQLDLRITLTTNVRVMIDGKMRRIVEYEIRCLGLRVEPDLSSPSTWKLPEGYVTECYTY